MKTVLFIVNHNITLYNFRKELVERLIKEKYRVVVVLPVTEDTKKITDLGCEVIDVPVERRGTNPVHDFKLFTAYRKVIKKVKPDVVLYEEGLCDETIRKSIEYIRNADVLIVGGTSLVVYPAAGLVRYFRGKNLVLINKSVTPMDKEANYVFHDSIGKVLEYCTE